jgi:hypothetical protein
MLLEQTSPKNKEEDSCCIIIQILVLKAFQTDQM